MEVQLNKYKLLCEKKAMKIKRLQDQVAHYKRKVFRQMIPNVPDDTEDIEHVNKQILV